MATKEELEKSVVDLQQQVEELSSMLMQERARHYNERYEMLNRIYPYLANELDSLRNSAGGDGR